MTAFVKLTIAWLALLILLAITVTSAFLDLGVWNAVLNIAIAVAKTVVIAFFFMHLASHGVLPRLTVVALGLWLGILFGLTLLTDHTLTDKKPPQGERASGRTLDEGVELSKVTARGAGQLTGSRGRGNRRHSWQ